MGYKEELNMIETSGALTKRYEVRGQYCKTRDHELEALSTETEQTNENEFVAACKQMLGRIAGNCRASRAQVPTHALESDECFKDIVGVFDNADATKHVLLLIELIARCGYLLSNQAMELMISKLERALTCLDCAHSVRCSE